MSLLPPFKEIVEPQHLWTLTQNKQHKMCTRVQPPSIESSYREAHFNKLNFTFPPALLKDETGKCLLC